MILALLLGCAFLFGVGVVFFIVDVRTRFGPLFRNFSVCLLVFPVVAALDLFSYAHFTGPETKLLLQRLMHLAVVPFIPFSIFYLLKLAGKTARWAWIFSIGVSTLIAPLCFSDAFLFLDGAGFAGGPAYPWTFLLYGTFYICFAYYVLVGHIFSVPAGKRKFPSLHLFGFVLASGGGFMDMLAVVHPPALVFFSCKCLGVMVFGLFCIYFYVDNFLEILRERNEIFHRLEALNRDFLTVQPLRSLGESTARISHEIKNYVTVLRSNQVLLRRRLSGQESYEEVDRMARSTDRLENFVRSLLDYSNSAGSLRMEGMDVHEAIRDSVALHFPSQAGMFRIASSHRVPPILGDKARLDQVFLNLFRNSLEARAEEIRVSVALQGESVSICLDDDGIGCAGPELDKVGVPFFTTKKAQGGTGLGLAIAASIVQSHGGSMQIVAGKQQLRPRPGFSVRLSFPIRGPSAGRKGMLF